MSTTATREANLLIVFDANARFTFWGSSEIKERGEPFFDLVYRKDSTATFANSENCDGSEDVLFVILLINNETTRKSLARDPSQLTVGYFSLAAEISNPLRDPRGIK